MKKQEVTSLRQLVVVEAVERKNVREKLKHESMRATTMRPQKTPNKQLELTC